MSDLEKLIEAVKSGGDISWSWASGPARSVFGYRWPDALNAYCGDLNAAKSLHDALLPGWEWHLGPSNAKIYPYNGSPATSWSGMADNPARAWLLAQLQALHASKAGA